MKDLEPNRLADRSITIGRAVVPYDWQFHHWILPGGEKTKSEKLARHVCLKIAKIAQSELWLLWPSMRASKMLGGQ